MVAEEFWRFDSLSLRQRTEVSRMGTVTRRHVPLRAQKSTPIRSKRSGNTCRGRPTTV